MPNKVVTMCDRFYFHYGRMFLKTRKNIDADFILYSPDLTSEQKKVLKKHSIECKPISSYIFNHCMQTLKFNLMADEMELDGNPKYGITYVDFDTFFPNDWQNKIFNKNNNFDLGITIRKNSIKNKDKKCYANGGVIFARNRRKSFVLCKTIDSIIFFGNSEKLEEYDEIWKTLEDSSRPQHKIHYRENHKWWGDQVALSSFVLRGVNSNQYKKINWEGYNIQFFDCNKFNKLNSQPKDYNDKVVCIRHLKNVGRKDNGV